MKPKLLRLPFGFAGSRPWTGAAVPSPALVPGRLGFGGAARAAEVRP